MKTPLMDWLAAKFDSLYHEARREFFDQVLVYVSVVSFVIHLALVFLANVVASPPSVLAAVGKNYFAAIYTPFSFILFYEVFLLIMALPKSTTQSIGKQYEIVSLIFIRKFFKDIAKLDDIGEFARLSPEVMPALQDVIAGLLMFFLVTLFLQFSRNSLPASGSSIRSPHLNLFIAQKKTIALTLTGVLILLAVYSLVNYLEDYSGVIYSGAKAHLDPNTVFYTELFTLMIFTDVLIVLLSVAVSDQYERVFRNAAFIISTILIRFSLTADRQYSGFLAIGGMTFGILTLLIYNYNLRVRARQQGP